MNSAVLFNPSSAGAVVSSSIAETVSENTPKPKRGRPKSWTGNFIDKLPRYLVREGCRRTQMSYGWESVFTAMTIRADDATKTCIGEVTKHRMAKVEVARYMALPGAMSEEAVLETIKNALNTGVSWKAIRAHFRELRLGQRQGNALSLYAHLSAAYDEYILRFPATTQKQRIAGIQNLLESVDDACDAE